MFDKKPIENHVQIDIFVHHQEHADQFTKNIHEVSHRLAQASRHLKAAVKSIP